MTRRSVYLSATANDRRILSDLTELFSKRSVTPIFDENLLSSLKPSLSNRLHHIDQAVAFVPIVSSTSISNAVTATELYFALHVESVRCAPFVRPVVVDKKELTGLIKGKRYADYVKRDEVIQLVDDICQDSSDVITLPHFAFCSSGRGSLVNGIEMIEIVPTQTLHSIDANRSGQAPFHKVQGQFLPKPFLISKYLITQANWKEVTGDVRPLVISHVIWSSRGIVLPYLPINCITWHDAKEFASRLNAMSSNSLTWDLPTELEWEYAATDHTIDSSRFEGDIGRLTNSAWYKGNSNDIIHPVGQRSANYWGLHDMLGNLEEWCSDSFDFRSSTDICLGSTYDPNRRDYRVIRGGCFLSPAQECSPTARHRLEADVRDPRVGFRVVARRFK